VTGCSSPTLRNWIEPPAEFTCRTAQKRSHSGKKVENVKVGEQVLFDKYSGSKLRIEDEDCLILKEEDILGVFTS
jgi:co-chaperonin GroES (HSP10)